MKSQYCHYIETSLLISNQITPSTDKTFNWKSVKFLVFLTFPSIKWQRLRYSLFFLFQSLSCINSRYLFIRADKKPHRCQKSNWQIHWSRKKIDKDLSLEINERFVNNVCVSMDWFLYDTNLRRERVKEFRKYQMLFLSFSFNRKLNPYSTNAPLPYSLKIRENLQFSDVFRGYRSGTLVQNGLITDCIIQILTLFIPILL